LPFWWTKHEKKFSFSTKLLKLGKDKKEFEEKNNILVVGIKSYLIMFLFSAQTRERRRGPGARGLANIFVNTPLCYRVLCFQTQICCELKMFVAHKTNLKHEKNSI